MVSPIEGTIQTVATQTGDPLTPLHPGDPVTAGQPLFTIAAAGGYIVKAEVDEQDIISVRPGQQVQITGEDFPGRTLTGRVSSIAPVATKSTDPSSTARQVLTTIALNQEPAFLRDGMTVDVDILTTDIRNAVTIPTAAIGKDAKGSYVFVARGRRLAKTYVRLGPKNDAETVVKFGLVPGAKIVATANPLLHDGQAVVVTPAAKATPAI